MTMKVLKSSAAAVVALVALSVPAQAQLLPTITPSCDDAITGGAFGGSTYTSVVCSGAHEGNNSGSSSPGEEATIAHMNELWGLDLSSGYDVGGPAGLLGDFVLAVKAADAFSLFYFTGVQALSIDYSKIGLGISLNSQGLPQAESHTTYYSVPEPGTMLLLSTGLLGMAALRRRREDLA